MTFFWSYPSKRDCFLADISYQCPCVLVVLWPPNWYLTLFVTESKSGCYHYSKSWEPVYLSIQYWQFSKCESFCTFNRAMYWVLQRGVQLCLFILGAMLKMNISNPKSSKQNSKALENSKRHCPAIQVAYTGDLSFFKYFLVREIH